MKTPLSNQFIFTVFVLFVGMKVFGNEKQAQDKAVIHKITYEMLSTTVKENNESIEAMQIRSRVQNEQSGFLGRSFFPEVGIVAGQEQLKLSAQAHEPQNFWQINAKMNIYNGGRDAIENQIRKVDASLADLYLTKTIQSSVREARLCFWKIVGIDARILIRKDALQRNIQNSSSAKRRAGVGLTTSADVVMFNINRIGIERELSFLEMQRQMTFLRLGSLMGLESDRAFEIDSRFPDLNDSMSSIKKIEPEKRWAQSIEKMNSQMEQLESLRLSQWWYPQIDAYSSLGLPSLQQEYDRAITKESQWVAGIRLNFSFGNTLEERLQAKSKKDNALATSKAVSQAVREIAASQKGVQKEIAQIAPLIQLVDQDIQVAQKFLQQTESEYNRGVKNGPDLLNATQKYFEFKDRKIQYQETYFAKKAEFESFDLD